MNAQISKQMVEAHDELATADAALKGKPFLDEKVEAPFIQTEEHTGTETKPVLN